MLLNSVLYICPDQSVQVSDGITHAIAPKVPLLSCMALAVDRINLKVYGFYRFLGGASGRVPVVGVRMNSWAFQGTELGKVVTRHRVMYNSMLTYNQDLC